MTQEKTAKPKPDQARKREEVLIQIHEHLRADAKCEREARQILSRELRRSMTMLKAVSSLLNLAAKSDAALDRSILFDCAELLNGAAATAAAVLKMAGTQEPA